MPSKLHIHGSLRLQFHLCGDNPVYDLEPQARADVLSGLAHKLERLQQQHIPPEILRSWEHLEDLPYTGMHLFKREELFRYMERKLKQAFAGSTSRAQPAPGGGGGMQPMSGPMEPMEPVEELGTPSLAMQCSPGQCCIPGTPHRTCQGEWVQFDERPFMIEFKSADPNARPYVVPVQLELMIEMVMAGQGDHVHGAAMPAGAGN